MGIDIKKSGPPVLALAVAVPLLGACGGGEPDDQYDSVDDLQSALESEGFGCDALGTSHEFDGYGESMACAEGHTLTVWDLDLPTGMEELSEGRIGGTQRLRGENWDVASSNNALLNDMQQSLGGERTSRGFQDY